MRQIHIILAIALIASFTCIKTYSQGNSLLYSSLFLPQFDLKAELNHKNFEYTWVNHPIDFYRNVILDTTYTTRTMLLETLGPKKGIMGSLLPIFLLKSTNPNITIEFKYKTKDCKNLSVITTSIGECENINYTDTIQLCPTEDWMEFTRTINTKKTYLLNTSIETIGFDDKIANVWISDFGVFVDGKEMRDNLKSKKENIYINKKDVSHWDNINHHTVPFLEHKILGIGETVHGTKTMNDIAITILKERILNHQCRFIFLEIPLEFSFYINRFVKNDPNFKLSDISTYLEAYLYPESLISFIQWLKEYNSIHNKKVSFWGFDINHVQLKSRVDLFNFFYNLNTNKHIEGLDNICNLLLDNKLPFDKIISLLNENNSFATMLNEDELKLMLYCMKITQQESRSYYRYVNRDKYMSNITTFIVDNFLKENETATIFGHFGHLNYLSTSELSIINYFSLGYYMKSKYKDDYRCIAITTNQGTALLTDSATTKPVVSKINHAPQESLEYQLKRLRKDSVYLSMDKLHCSDVFKLRFLGSVNFADRFRYIIPKSRMEGILYVDSVMNIEKDEDVLRRNSNKNFIIINSYKEALDKMKNK